MAEPVSSGEPPRDELPQMTGREGSESPRELGHRGYNELALGHKSQPMWMNF